MQRYYRLAEDKIVEGELENSQIRVFIAPTDEEKRCLVDQFKIDEHTLQSALDPDEVARVEFEPDHAAIIFKYPRKYSSEDNFLFRVASTALFVFKDRLIIVLADDMTLFDGRPFLRVRSIEYVVLKLFYNVILHFTQHLRGMNMISTELEQQINTSMDNKHLLNMFTLEKGLVYYFNAINSNGRIFDKLKVNAAKIGFTPENLEFLDDIIIENNQCSRQAEIYSNILASLMDARASIVANNLNLLIKTLTMITITIMLPTLIVSIFSMNVALPLAHDNSGSFWVVLVLAVFSSVAFCLYWRYRKW